MYNPTHAEPMHDAFCDCRFCLIVIDPTPTSATDTTAVRIRLDGRFDRILKNGQTISIPPGKPAHIEHPND